MPKLTVIEMVQEIMGDLGLTPVNDIGGSDDAQRIATIIRSTYRYLSAARRFPEQEQIGTLIASADSNRPTHMVIPDDVQEVFWIQYDVSEVTDTRQRFADITYKEPEDFLNLLQMRDDTLSTVQVVQDYSENRKLFIQNDKRPEYWTSFDDEHVVFDSFDSATIDDTIQQSKIIAGVLKEPVFTISNTFIPDLSSKSFPLLLNEATKAASIKIVQAPDEEAERRGRRLFTRGAWEKYRINGGIKVNNYGRK
jgi:hypothetical protein